MGGLHRMGKRASSRGDCSSKGSEAGAAEQYSIAGGRWGWALWCCSVPMRFLSASLA